MYSLTINCENATQLGAVAKHLEALELPAYLRSEASKLNKADKPGAVEYLKTEDTVKTSKPKAEKPKVEKAKEEESDGTTYDQVKEATFQLAGLPGDGPKFVKEVLAQFGVDHATKLTEKQWKPYIDAAAKKFDENKPEEKLA